MDKSAVFFVTDYLFHCIPLQILAVSSPSVEYVSDSDEGSDSDDSSLLSEDQPLIRAVQSASNPNTLQSNLLTTLSVTTQESYPRTGSPSSLGDFSAEDVDVNLINGMELMLRRAMSSLEKTNDVSCLLL